MAPKGEWVSRNELVMTIMIRGFPHKGPVMLLCHGIIVTKILSICSISGGILSCQTSPVRGLPLAAPLTMVTEGGLTVTSAMSFTYKADPVVTSLDRTTSFDRYVHQFCETQSLGFPAFDITVTLSGSHRHVDVVRCLWAFVWGPEYEERFI